MMDYTGEETGFTVHQAKTKKKIRKSTAKGEYVIESLQQRMNMAAIEHFNEPLETALLRHELYQQHWKDFQSKINSFEESCLNELIQEVVSFVEGNVCEQGLSLSEYTEIPVGFIVTGENKLLIGKILEEISATTDVSLVRISANKCPNVKSAFQNVAKQLVCSSANVSRHVGTTQMEDPEESMEESLEEDEANSSGKQRHLSLYDINKWYNSGTKSRPRPYVLIVLDDVDTCPDGVIGELLLLLSCLKFPYTVLLGLISEFTPLNKFFPRDLAEACKIEEFKRLNPKASLEHFIEQAIYDLKSPFRLSGRVISSFQKYFLHNNFSISRLLQGYQLCLMEHFRKPESIFCQFDITAFWNSESFGQLNPVFLESISSVSSSIDKKAKSPSKSPKKKPRVLDEFEKTKAEFLNKLKKCYKEILEWYECFLLLFQFGLELPESPIGRTKESLFISACTGALYKEDEKLETPISPFGKLVNLISNFSVTELKYRLDAAYCEIQDFYKSNASTKLVDLHLGTGIPYQLMNFIASLDAAVMEDKAAEEAASLLQTIEPVVAKTKAPRRQSLRASSQTQWAAIQAEIKQKIAEKKGPILPAFTKARKDIKRFFEISIAGKFKKIQDIPLAQIYVFDDVRFLEKQLFPSIPKEIHVALCLPQKYLNCECCGDTQMDSIQNFPDASILYKLLQERQHHIIDLNSLYISFKSLQPKVNEPKRRTSMALKKAKAEEDALIKRFGQAYEELQFLGLMKRKKKKPDEATKLSWIFE